MCSVATAFDVHTNLGLGLLKIILEEAHINIPKEVEVAAYCIFDGDKPANFRAEYIELSLEDPSTV